MAATLEEEEGALGQATTECLVVAAAATMPALRSLCLAGELALWGALLQLQGLLAM